MKAVVFVQNEGWSKAIDVMKNLPRENSARYRPRDNKYSSTLSSGDSVCTIQLKKLIESWEYVQIHGLENSKEIIEKAPAEAECYSWTIGNTGIRDKTVLLSKLKDAIKDVESVGIEKP